MGRSETPKLQGNQSVNVSGSVSGEGGSMSPTAQPAPPHGSIGPSMPPASFTVDPRKTFNFFPSVQIETDRKFYH